MERGFCINRARFALSFPQLQDGMKSRRVSAGDCGHSVDCLALVGRHRLAERENSMAKKSAKRGNGIQHQLEQNFVAVRRGQNRLAQTEPAVAQFAFHLKPMELQRNLEIRKKILTEKHTVMALHVEQLNREHIGGTAQLFKRED